MLSEHEHSQVGWHVRRSPPSTSISFIRSMMRAWLEARILLSCCSMELDEVVTSLLDTVAPRRGGDRFGDGF